MENFIHIEKQLKEMNPSGISCRKRNVFVSILLIIIGVALFVVGTKSIVEMEALNMTMIIFGLGLFIYGIVKMCIDLSSLHFFYDQTGQRLKKYKVYVATSERNKISQMFRNRDFQQICEIKRAEPSGCMLFIMVTDNGDCCAIQSHDLTTDTFDPSSDTILLTGAEAMPVYKFACNVI